MISLTELKKTADYIMGIEESVPEKTESVKELQEKIDKLSYKDRMKLQYSKSDFDMLKYYTEATVVYQKKNDIFIKWLKEKGETEETIIERIKKYYKQ